MLIVQDYLQSHSLADLDSAYAISVHRHDESPNLVPVARPADWVQRVNRPQSAKELAAMDRSLKRGQPFGDAAWQTRTAAALNLQSAFRDRGRPKKERVP